MRALRFLNLMILSVSLVTSVFLFAQDEKQQEEPKQEEPKTKQEEPKKQDEKMQKQQDKDMKKQAAQSGGNAHAAGKGGHIPDDKFRAHFGHSHTFRAQTVIVSGQTQFQYGGYSFEFVDAWPAGWAYTDDCYIDYIDGQYFLFDVLHPGIRIAVIVVI
jgi:hypothetical protein